MILNPLFALLMFFISTTMTNHPSKKRRNLDRILNFLIHNFLSLTLSRHNWITLDKSASKNPPECRHKAIRESGGDGGHQGGICIGEAWRRDWLLCWCWILVYILLSFGTFRDSLLFKALVISGEGWRVPANLSCSLRNTDPGIISFPYPYLPRIHKLT